MNSKIIKICAISLIFCFLFSFFTFASNEEKEPQPKATYISAYSARIDHGAVTTKVNADLTGTSSVTKVKIKMELQKLSDGVYSTVETWEQTFNSRTGSMEESKITNPFSTYRLKTTFTAYTSSTSETRTYYVYDN